MSKQHEPVASRFLRVSVRLLALVLIVGTAVHFATERRENAMRPSAFASSSTASRPLIDTAQPEQVATATFAMG